MASNLPYVPSQKAQMAIVEYVKNRLNFLTNQYNIRNSLRTIDLAYMREMDLTAEQWKARFANATGDSTRFQNITLPIVLPAVEAAVVYQSAVFLQGTPIFGCVSNPTYQDAAMQMEALLEQQQTYGGWSRHLQMFFRDGEKYNWAPMEVTWDRIVTPTFDTDPAYAGRSEGKPKNVIWEGNCIKRLDPYNTFVDLRVLPTELPTKGEFAGYTELVPRMTLIRYLNSLPSYIISNYAKAMSSGIGSSSYNSSMIGSYYIPYLNPEALVNPSSINLGTNWLSYTGQSNPGAPAKGGVRVDYKDAYERNTIYCRIIPQELYMDNVPSKGTPQIWKFVLINQQTLIYAERQTNAHDKLPILIGQPLEDGLGFQTKSTAKNVQPIQEVGTALVNSLVAARRRAISDRVLYDPSKINSKDINSDNPSAKIPVRPAAYGKPLSEAVYAFPFRDDQSGVIMQEIPMFSNMGNQITGSNPAKQGQFVKGNKTQSEYDSVMNNSNGRDQTKSLLYETQVFTPLKEILKINIFQYQGPTTVFASGSTGEARPVEVDPVKLRNAIVQFKMTDGLTPASKQINGDTLSTVVQVLGSSPQLASGFNLSPMFGYLMKTQGANLKEFEKSQSQMAYESAVSNWKEMMTLALTKGQKWDQPMPQPAQFGYLQPGQETPPAPDPLQTFMSTLQATAQQAPVDQATQVTQPTQ